jgi:hypothetical protein
MEGFMMKKPLLSHPGWIIALGSVWGLTEAGLGLGLQRCAQSASGSIMTGVALFFIAGAWMLSRNGLGIVLVVIVASLFKMFDAWLLSLSLLSGTIAHPILAFVIQGAVFWIILRVLARVIDTQGGRVAAGLCAGLGSSLLFPLVKVATGIPACLHAGTGLPLSVVFGPLAMIIAAGSVPAGMRLGERLPGWRPDPGAKGFLNRVETVFSPIILMICLVLVTIIRIV